VNCRHCGATLTLDLIDLGSAPPSNAYLSAEALHAPERWYPLRVRVCERCWLVQTEDYAGAEDLFTPDYAYFSSYSRSWLAHAERYVTRAVRDLGLDGSSCVVEVAANDGYLLQYVQALGIPCYGIEPTAGTAAAARARGIGIVEEFFGRHLAIRLLEEGRPADLMVANNVLAHVPDIDDFVAGFAILLKADGVATFEFPHLLSLVEKVAFDTLYHEHFSYLSLTAVSGILAANGLSVFHVEELTTHGGSLRVYAQRRDTGRRAVTPAVGDFLAREGAAGVRTQAFYAGFQERAERVKDDLLAYLIETKRKGLAMAAYGAAAKGNTLLNFAGVRPDLLPYVADRNPEKQGKYLPGSRIPIVAEDHLRSRRPDRILILPWNLREEVVTQLAYAREWGARFVTAIPRLHESER